MSSTNPHRSSRLLGLMIDAPVARGNAACRLLLRDDGRRPSGTGGSRSGRVPTLRRRGAVRVRPLGMARGVHGRSRILGTLRDGRRARPGRACFSSAGVRRRIGWVGVLTFHVLLMLFGLGFWLWSVPAIALLLYLARRDLAQRRQAAHEGDRGSRCAGRAFRRVVDVARRAPSVHNTQPWTVDDP